MTGRRRWRAAVAAVATVPLAAALVTTTGRPAAAADGGSVTGFGASGLAELADAALAPGGGRVVPLAVRDDNNGGLLVRADVETDTASIGGLLLRVLADGRLDPAFGAGGVVALPDAPTGVAPLLDGRYLVARSGAWARLGANGAADASFRAPVPVAAIQDLLPLPDGRTLVVGTNQLVAVDVNGAVDPSFSATAALAATAVVQIGAVGVADDGRVVVGSYLAGGGADECRVVGLDGHGQLDAGYGTGGAAVPQAEGAPMLDCVLTIGSDGTAAAAWFDSSGLSGVVSVLGPTGAPTWTRVDRSRTVVGDGLLAFDGAGRLVEASMDPDGGTSTVRRMNTDGSDDLAFGTAGVATVSGARHLVNPVLTIPGTGGVVLVGDANDAGTGAHVGMWLASLQAAAGIGPEAPLRSTTAFVPLAPTRLLDTRVGLGAPAAKPAAGGIVDLQVAGAAGIPADAAAVVLNVTATDAGGAGFVTVWPSGGRLPLVSNLNLERAGQTVANLVTVSVGAGGKVSLFTLSSSHLLADVAGYYRHASSATSGRFVPAPSPTRLLDTRVGLGAPAVLPGAGAVVDLQVSGAGPVPASGVSAVVLNLTGVDATATGFVTAWPSGTPRPLASNLNLAAHDVRANLVVVPVGANGRVSLYTQAGTHLLADVTGWFTDATAPDAVDGLFVPIAPRRMLDTRLLPGAALGAGGILARRIGATSVVPPGLAGAVVANVTVTESAAPGYVTAWPGGTTRPLASNLNMVKGQTVANLTMVGLGGEAMALYTQSAAHLIVDVSGWFVL